MNKSALFFFSIVSVALTACALGEVLSDSDAAPTSRAVSAQAAFCAAGFSFDSSHQLCVSASEAVGPFPRAMIDRCKQFVANRADGSNSCETTPDGRPATRWAKTLAIDSRKATLQGACVRGTTFDASLGYCSDGGNLYGPFSKDDVAFCKSLGGGATCETNRVHPSFAKKKGVAFDVAREIAVRDAGASIGRLVIAIGHAEGTLFSDGRPTSAYFGHMDSGIPNIGLWSCTVCGARTPKQADQYYYDQFIAPELGGYRQAAGALASHPMVAATFFGLLVQSPEAALSDADADDLALITLLARGRLSAPVTEAKLLDLLVASWTVNGVMQWRSPDTGQIDPARGRQDQLRRLGAYATALRANGVNPYP